MKKVSIITSVYNKESYLDKFFESVLCQSYENFELIAVNNASTDSSPIIIHKYATLDHRIIVINKELNIGPADGLATALDNVTGYYFTVLDADDYIDPDYIEKLVYAIEEGDADVSMCVNDMVTDDGEKWHKPWPESEFNIVENDGEYKLICQLLNEQSNEYYGHYMPEIGAEWIKLYKTKIVKDAQINYEKELWKWLDFVFNVRVMKVVDKIAYIRSTVYHFNQSDDSATRQTRYNKDFFPKQYLALNRILQEIQSIMNPNLKNAFCIFATRILQNFYDYIIKYKNELTTDEIRDAIKKLIDQPAYKYLFIEYKRTSIPLRQKILIHSICHNWMFCYNKFSIAYYFAKKLIKK